jgi:hypothetical protein
LFAGAVADALAQPDWCGCGQGVQLVEDGCALGDCRAPGDQERPDGGENAARPWCGDVLVGEHVLGGGDRVDAVRLSGSPIAATWALVLEDRMAGVE